MKKFTFFTLFVFAVAVSAQLPNCKSNEFYAVGDAGDDWGKVILKFELQSPLGPVSYNGSTSPVVEIGAEGPYVSNFEGFSNPMGLAIADFGDGTQFYASTMSFAENQFIISKYDGNEWETVMPEFFCHQMGGKNEHLYLQVHPIMGYIENDRIYHYDGNEAVLIWESQSDTDRVISADIAVDSEGNAYFFTGNIIESPGVADTLHIISPGGEIISEFPIEISTMGSSGAFFMYDTLYLFFGPYMYLVPVHISSSGAVAGAQIPIPKVYLETVFGPNGTFDLYFIGTDADSCFGETLRLNDFLAVKKSKVYPNPVTDQLIIESKEIVGEIEIYNLAGQKLMSTAMKALNGEVDVQNLPAGTYLIKLISEGKITETHKFIKL